MNNLESLVESLKKDLRNECTHLAFYLQSASLVQGLHAKEYKEHFLKETSKEITHINQFADLIIGLGGDNLDYMPYFEKIPQAKNPIEILKTALNLEEEVVANYCERMHEAESLGSTDGDWIHIFLEKQIEESRIDVDELKQIIRGYDSGY